MLTWLWYDDTVRGHHPLWQRYPFGTNIIAISWWPMLTEVKIVHHNISFSVTFQHRLVTMHHRMVAIMVTWWHVTPEQDASTERKYFTDYPQYCVNQCPLKLAWTAHFLRPFLSVWCVTPWQCCDDISQHYSDLPAHDNLVTGTIILIFKEIFSCLLRMRNCGVICESILFYFLCLWVGLHLSDRMATKTDSLSSVSIPSSEVVDLK